MSMDRDSFLKHLKKSGISKRTLDAIGAVDRMKFFDPLFSDRVFSQEPVPIGNGQRSDDPLALARMIDHLAPRKKWRVFEAGTGSGYSTAVLSHLVDEVVTVEYHDDLARRARSRIMGEGYSSVRFFCGDATDPDMHFDEFDGAVVFAACMRTPYSIMGIVKPGGPVVFPMGPAHQQRIARYMNNLNKSDIGKNFTFYDLCAYDSIRGIYGWIDPQDVPNAGEPVEKPAKEDNDSGR
jgi:protein-L-isoaspartate(D-aspartate) O-methyltransferase